MANVANPERGEVELQVKSRDGNVEKTYVLKLSINAARALQKKYKGKPMGEIVAGLDKMDFESIADIAFMLLQKHHSEEVTTPDKAGDVLDDCGGVVPFAMAFRELISMKDAEGNANPPKAQEPSTTGDSTSTPVAPA